MLSSVAAFLLGLVGLLGAGHVLVDSASRIGARLGLTPMAIGLTIVAAGTSAPELAVVGQAIVVNDTELAVGSIIGSNISNVLLVLGLAAVIGKIAVTTRAVQTDIPVMIAASVAFVLFSLDGAIERHEGVLMLLSLLAFVGWTLRATRSDPSDRGESVDGRRLSQGVPVRGSIIRLVVAVVGLSIAARFVVRGAEGIAEAIGLPELVVGLTVVALGTSAPEIVTTLVAATRGRADLAVGNAVGSNIFNILLVLGAAGLVAPDGIAISSDALRLDLPVLLAAAIACLPVVAWDHTLDRWEGGVFVGYYISYTVFLFLDGSGNGIAQPFAIVMLGLVLPLTIITMVVVIVRARRHLNTSRLSDLSKVDLN
ncbi:MAG: calcium/sodium antiporter [Acidimicrobiales bacterium]|nr:calcium/sodium antiporter [Acidimicrobiales bacterium]RZV48351.1 MAG: calcium/sodium antiporter [Acidimicrobiales bacterium]